MNRLFVSPFLKNKKIQTDKAKGFSLEINRWTFFTEECKLFYDRLKADQQHKHKDVEGISATSIARDNAWQRDNKNDISKLVQTMNLLKTEETDQETEKWKISNSDK